MSELEAVLANVAIFEHRRPDEGGRIARRFEIVNFTAGQRHGGAASDARLARSVRPACPGSPFARIRTSRPTWAC